MISAMVDTNILIELYRSNVSAKTWITTQSTLAIPSIVALELMDGAQGKQAQRDCQKLIDTFEVVFLTTSDQQWAYAKVIEYRPSHGIGFADCLIASVAYRLQVPLFTRNLKYFVPLLNATQVIKPY